MSEPTPYMDRVLSTRDRILAPSRRWAEAGFASGVTDIWPELPAPTSALVDQRAITEAMASVFAGLDRQNVTQETKFEAALRMEFNESLVRELMAEESRLHVVRHLRRRKGMLARTCGLAVAIVALATVGVGFPWWFWVPFTVLVVATLSILYRKYELEDRSAPRPSDISADIASAMPWAGAAG